MLFKAYPAYSVKSIADSYDFIIIGGGTAGCVLANRLSKDRNVTVLLLEKGGVSNGWISRVPILSSAFVGDSSRSRHWKCQPQQHVDNRVLELTTGESLGGTSKINAMLYTRGLPAEFDGWSAAGCNGWSYAELKKYFTQSERALDESVQNLEAFHGVTGEWENRSYGTMQWEHSNHIIRATSAMGIPYVEDLNSPLQPPHGCAKMHYTINKTGERSSTLSAFLPDSIVHERKGHLHVCTFAHVYKVSVQSDATSQLRCEGVYVEDARTGDKPRFIRARREIILSAGALASPKVLMLSGIGPVDHLREHHISPVKELSGVGTHLQDHLAVPMQYQVPLHDSLVKLQLQPLLFLIEIVLYLFFGRGLLLCPVVELSIFIQTRLFDKTMRRMFSSEKNCDASLPENLPDVEVMPVSYGKPDDCTLSKQGGLAFLTALLRPLSTGTVRLASGDPLDEPVVDPNYLASKHDMEVLRRGLKFVKQLKPHMVTQGYRITDHLVPRDDPDGDLDAFIRKHCMTTFHYTSTCRMASEKDGGVVDSQLRVHGVQGLRVADASIFPYIPGTHLAAVAVLVAEKCADMVLQSFREDQAS